MEFELEKARQQLVSAKVCTCIFTHFSVYSSFVKMPYHETSNTYHHA